MSEPERTSAMLDAAGSAITRNELCELCAVHDAFKVVVVVEAQHAHERLDLPLLNRFEKQLFTPEHALSPRQRALLAELPNIEWDTWSATDYTPPDVVPVLLG